MRRQKTVCAKCNKDPVLSTSYDRFYCEGCDIWIEPECSCNNGDCPFPIADNKKPSRCELKLKPTQATCTVQNEKTKLAQR